MERTDFADRTSLTDRERVDAADPTDFADLTAAERTEAERAAAERTAEFADREDFNDSTGLIALIADFVRVAFVALLAALTPDAFAPLRFDAIAPILDRADFAAISSACSGCCSLRS